MKRLFLCLLKCFKQINSKNELEIYNQYINSVDINTLTCPFCGAKYSLKYLSSYKRHLVTYEDDKSIDNLIIVPRVICSSCNHTHAILPSVLIPYISFSVYFTISIIHDYLIHKFSSVEDICKNYNIAITTFYHIYKKFIEHKQLWLGLMEDYLTPNISFIKELLESSFANLEQFISDFFSKTFFSFLQGNIKLSVT